MTPERGVGKRKMAGEDRGASRREWDPTPAWGRAMSLLGMRGTTEHVPTLIAHPTHPHRCTRDWSVPTSVTPIVAPSPPPPPHLENNTHIRRHLRRVNEAIVVGVRCKERGHALVRGGAATEADEGCQQGIGVHIGANCHNSSTHIRGGWLGRERPVVETRAGPPLPSPKWAGWEEGAEGGVVRREQGGSGKPSQHPGGVQVPHTSSSACPHTVCAPGFSRASRASRNGS
jgi:hypothetical protein